MPRSVKVVETQTENNCTLHAINNAFQRVVVTPADAMASIRARFERSNASLRAKGKSELVWETFRDEEMLHGYSLSDLYAALRRQGYVPRNFAAQDDRVRRAALLNGMWVVLGRYPNFAHAIAVRDGFVIESIADSEARPYHVSERKSLWPRGFTVDNLFCLSALDAPQVIQSDTIVLED